MNEVGQIPIDDIKVGEHAQRIDAEDPDTVELAASIRRVGIINPLVVVRDGDELHLLAGHRRLVAACLAGLKVVPCFIRPSEKDVDAEISFAENFFRKDLSPVELAAALKDCLTKETMTIQQLAAGFHKSEHWVHSMIAIADWPDDVLEALHNEQFSVSAAHNLACVTEPDYRAFLVRNAVESGATARTTAAWLQAWRSMAPPEEAITAEPVAAGTPRVPLVPQAPCLCCSQLFMVNKMSHVPICGGCIQVLRQVGRTLPAMDPNQQGPQGPGQVG